MGRSLLILAALAAALGCAQSGATPRVRAATAHDDVTCAACHGGVARLTAATAHASDAACTSSGCHADGGPADAQLANVSFRHREHGRSGGRVAPCAGCHTHAGDVQDRRLASTADACALCHAEQLAGKRSSDCRSCHKDPEHVPVTPQGVPIPHSSLAESQTGCLRCHYDVSAPTRTVSSKRCATCHADRTVAQGVGENLHPAHAGIACTGCHEGAKHRVLAMSSAVVLDCRDCHGVAHQARLAELGNPSATCTTCHGSTHQAQQRLLLGEVPGMAAQPSMKFAAGLTCRSCHTPPASGAAAPQPVRGQASSCAGCHRTEYTQVLAWWRRGTQERATVVGAYVRQAAATLGGSAPDSARRLLGWADSALKIVAAGGGEHNIELSDEIFRRSLASARSAYGVAGRAAPAPPALGNAPHVGFCSYCHYRMSDPWEFQRMPAEFHKSVLDTLRVNAAESPAR